MARARPVAGSMSICVALKTTGPSPTSNRVGSALMNRGRTVRRVEPDDAPDRAGHAKVRLVGGAAWQDPLVARDDVRVGPDDHADPTVEVQPERVLLRGQLAMEVDQADRRQRLGRGRLVEQRVGVGEGVLDRLHVGPALQVDDRDVRAIERVVRAPTAARGPRGCRSCAGGAPARSTRGTGRSRFLSQMWLPEVMTSTPAARIASAVDGVRPIPPATFSPLAVTKSMPRASRSSGSSRSTAWRPGLPIMSPIIRTRQAPFGRGASPFGDVPEARPPDGGGRVYFAYSTARVSRMTVTLIWPG